MTGNPTSVLFDMGNVLFRYDPARRLRHISELCDLPEKEVQDRVFATDFEQKCETGALTAEQSLSEFNRLCGSQLTHEQFQGALTSAFEADGIVFGIAKELAITCPLAGFTNNGFVARDGLALLHPDVAVIFGNHLYCSAQFGAQKPNSGAFEGVLSAWGCKPDEVLFIDDNEDNARAALTLGFHVHRFFDAESLETDLRSYGFL